ncbi:hypothetical protein LTS07_004095 [Exophiala sideris]|nr:hypothetical protein LTS07_004095 [Exophiala sideris]
METVSETEAEVETDIGLQKTTVTNGHNGIHDLDHRKEMVMLPQLVPDLLLEETITIGHDLEKKSKLKKAHRNRNRT